MPPDMAKGSGAPSWLDEVLNLADNRVLLPQLGRQVREAGIIPFVGAGLSAPYNLPQWGALVRGLAPDATSRAEVDALLKENDYEGAAELLMNVRGPRQFQRLFRSEFDVRLDLSKRTAVTALARLGRGPIITTNFDQVLEKVLDAEGCDFKVIVGQREAQVADAFQYNSDALLKVHGDFEDPESRVLTKTEYDSAYAQWLKVLLKNVATRCLLFLGCSLKTDRPLAVLAELVNERHVQTEHYALLSMPASDGERLQRSRELSEQNRINVIYYPAGQHGFIEKILLHLADQVPAGSHRVLKTARRPRYVDLPVTRSLLFGRDPDELVSLIEGSRIVSVEGDRGCGKTAYALETVRRFIDRDTFGALVWFTASTLKSHLRLEMILDRISLAIDYPFKPQTKPEEKEALLVAELLRKQIHCLLLLDNYETVTDEEIKAFLFERLPEQLTVLLTSRERVVHERVRSFPLDELKPDAAAAMFRERLTRDGLDQESDADVTRLYQVVGGNPLAMEWIVGQLRQGDLLPYVLNQLKRGKANILDQVFAHAWARLDENCRAVMKALPIFVRPVLEATLRATSGLDEDAFHEGLRTLTRLYLVKRLRLQEGPTAELTGRRYFVHPFTRDFLEAQSTPDATRTIVVRAASYYVDYVTARGGTPDKEESAEIAQLNSERENILGTVDACATVGDQGTAVRLVQAAARWLFIESHWNDLVRYGENAAEEALALGGPHAAARILAEVGRVYSYRSEVPLADKTFTRALTLARTEPPDKWSIAYLQHHIGEQLARQRQYREAETELKQSLAGFEEVQDARAAIGVRYRMAMVAYDTNAVDRAWDLATRGIRETLAVRWKRLEGFNRRLLGDVAILRNDVPEARYQYQLALALVPRTDMRIQALLELSLARLDCADGAAAEARSRAKIALEHFEKLSMPQEAEEARRLAAGLIPTRA